MDETHARHFLSEADMAGLIRSIRIEEEGDLSRNTSIIVILGLTVLGALLRFYRLDTDLWLDEIATLSYAAQPILEQWTVYLSPNNHALNSFLIKVFKRELEASVFSNSSRSSASAFCSARIFCSSSLARKKRYTLEKCRSTNAFPAFSSPAAHARSSSTSVASTRAHCTMSRGHAVDR